MNPSNINIKINKIGKNDEHYITTIDNNSFQKMMFVYNAINDGWCVKKKDNSFTFTKNHEGKQEIFDDEYLSTFIVSNLDMNKLLSNK